MARDAAGELPAMENLHYRRKLLWLHDSGRLSEVLSEGFCGNCHLLLQERLRLLIRTTRRRHYPGDFTPESCDHDCNSEVSYHGNDNTPESHHHHRHRSPKRDSYSAENRNKRKRGMPEYAGADLALDDGIAGVSSGDARESRHYHRHRSPERDSYSAEYGNKRMRGLPEYSGADLEVDDGIAGVSSGEDLYEEQKEKIRFANVRKQEFVHRERIDGKVTNILEGLELHSGVFDKEEQKNIVDYVYHLQHKGQRGELRERTYSEPRKWMRGKGRVTIQFGCCYNYAKDKKGTPPGIVRDEEVDPLPSLFKKMIKRMVKWHILPRTCVPDSCIVNIYDEGDCIPPHIDHHDFLRPFCTVSFLTESNILFGSRLEILSPGEFSGPVSIPLPMGSALVLSGNGADLAKHCVPSVSAKRISITFRKMDDRKLPYRFLPDLELQRIKPLNLSQFLEEGEEEEIVQAEDGERKQRDHHHFHSPMPLDLTQWQEEERKNVRVKEGKRKQRDHYHYYSPKPLDLTRWQKEEKNVQLEEGEIKQRIHHNYYTPKRSSQRSKRQRYEVGLW
ncbi:RNA demethylase ALKBH5-like [Momordica charantia]|uniref:RNA demethylase ALKBH5-like n=1 Tax=Momordica charantia TaxID=3673 RepID=A0A6J1D7M0_MOMCH|nr:RNA demethylase ALKBH5-like [Momordica charantia]